MKIVFMGTPDFAVETLKKCIDQHEVLAVFTQPDKPKGRGKKMASPPVKIVAEENGIPVYQPLKIKQGDWSEKIKAMNADMIVVVAYGQILDKAILTASKYGAINVHASLLPAYRGAAPINWCIIKGEKETGITTMLMDEGLDTGDMLLKTRVPIDPSMTFGELHDVLAVKGADLLIETLDKWILGEIHPEKQNHDESSYASKIDKSMAEIDFSQSAESIYNLIRGFNPWPVAYTFYEGKRLKIYGAQLTDEATNPHFEKGQIVNLSPNYIDVNTGEGILRITEIQLGSAKRMSVSAFLLGHTMALGDRFIRQED